jgi:hypothetical protein
MGVGVWGVYIHPPKDLHTSRQNWLEGMAIFLIAACKIFGSLEVYIPSPPNGKNMPMSEEEEGHQNADFQMIQNALHESVRIFKITMQSVST